MSGYIEGMPNSKHRAAGIFLKRNTLTADSVPTPIDCPCHKKLRITLIKSLLFIIIAIAPLCMGTWLTANAAVIQEDSQPLSNKGPNGGKVVQNANYQVELAIKEGGVAPPQFRAWVSRVDGEQLTKPTSLEVRLTRLGDRVIRYSMSMDGNLWTNNITVEEPHSFDIKVILTVEGETYVWQWPSYEWRTTIASDMVEKAGITTALAGPGKLRRTVKTYGRVVLPSQQISHMRARFPGLVKSVAIEVGDRVKKGDLLAVVEANGSLKRYRINAPINGIVTERHANTGELALEQVLFSLVNPDRLWVELRVFESQLADVVAGQAVSLESLTLKTDSTIRNVIPSMDDHPFVIARSEIDNKEGAWSPGMFVKGNIVVDETNVPLLVNNQALQSVAGWTVVFVRVGDIFEARPLTLGRTDGRYTEVLSGLPPGDRYVVNNSYLIKADIEKSGASHDH